MATDCPYCSLAKKSGELYCSMHQEDMAGLESGVFYIREKQFDQCQPHVTRLSLNFNLDDNQPYFVGNKHYTVSPTKYLLINQGQSFSTLANGQRDSRMVTIAFKVGLAEQLYHDLSHTQDKLLANPVADETRTLTFFEQTHLVDDYLNARVPGLLSLSEDAQLENSILQEKLDELLTHIISVQLRIGRDVEAIDKLKPSTRMEIYKRLHTGFEYMHDNYDRKLTIDAIARHACLSSFNFKRLFRDFYKQTPHQLISNLRMNKAADQLKAGVPVKDVCRNVGYEDVSSFIRLFKRTMGVTPDQFRSPKKLPHAG
jgi:AraC family transcriptional regulator